MSKDSELTIVVMVQGEGDQRPVARQLEGEVRRLSIISVDRPVRPVPEGAKSGGAQEAGALIVTLGATLVPAFVKVIVQWLSRRKDTATRVKLAVGDKVLELEHSQPLSEELLAKMVETLR